MQILFYDPMTPYAYDAETPRLRAIGGTEATVIRIAEALKTQHSVYVAQHCRQDTSPASEQGVCYLSFEAARRLNPDVVILLRQYRLLGEVAQNFPKARRYLWLHNMPSRELYSARRDLEKYGCQILAVSQFHRAAIERRLSGNGLQRLLSFSRPRATVPVHVLYNPIEDELRPDTTGVEAHQLLFMSSPQKGLKETLERFAAVQDAFPEYELLIANPGYNHLELSLPPQARFLGALPHHQVIQQLRRAFCVFYPQTARVETFGLVYAEANAVGTPVLAHDAGAAREVLSDTEQVLNGQNLRAVLDKLSEWRKQRPRLQGKEEFRLSQVKKAWLQLLAAQ
jgi:glycosyltransferase involved in cell wall biosynthesis